MRITIGSGKNRHSFDRPLDRVERDMFAEQIKNFLFRPALLNKDR